MAVESATGVSAAKLKDAMTSSTVMNYYDPNMRTEVSLDVSPVSLAAILAQREDDHTGPRIVAYARRVPIAVASTPRNRGQSTRWYIFLSAREFCIITERAFIG